MKNMPNDNTEATSLNAPEDAAASTAGVKTVGKEVGPFSITVHWKEENQAGEESRNAVLAAIAELAERVNTGDNAQHINENVDSITIARI